MTEGKKESPNDAHGGRITKKGWIRRGVEQKSQCATYTHRANVGWRTAPPQAPPHCAVHDEDDDDNSATGFFSLDSGD
jgi:hypothetical protein